MDMVKHFRSSQNSKFSMSVEYLKKEVRDEVDFLHTDKYQTGLRVDFNTLGTKEHFGNQSWLQGDTMIIGKHDEAFSSYSK